MSEPLIHMIKMIILIKGLNLMEAGKNESTQRKTNFITLVTK